MKTPSEPSLSRAKVMTIALVNQLAFPGLGTIMAGRRAGYFQAALMLVGFFLVTGVALWFIFQAMSLADTNTRWNEAAWKAQALRMGGLACLGFLCCVASWCWALVDTLQLLRLMRENASRQFTPPPIINP